MLEKSPKEIADIKTYSPEEAEQLVDKPISFGGYSEAFYGKENIDELRLLLADPVIRDIDLLLLTGEISKEEAVEYFMALDDVELLLRQLKAHAQKMAAHIEKKISHYVKDLVEWDGKIKVSSVMKLLRGASNIILPFHHLSYQLIGVCCAISYFNSQLMGALLTAVRKEVAQKYPKDQCAISHKVASCDDESLMGTGYPLVYGFLHSFDHVLTEPEYARLRTVLEGPAVDEDTLQSMFRELRTLSLFRNISFSATSDKGVEFNFIDESLSEATKGTGRIFNICMIAIRDTSNRKNGAGLACSVDRHTGELTLAGADIKNLVGEEKERILRCKIFTLLLDHLRQKEEDIAHAPATPPKKKPEPKAIQAEVLKEVAQQEIEQPKPELLILPREEEAVQEPQEQEEVFEGYDKYQVAIKRLREAFVAAAQHNGESGGKLRMLRVENDKIAGRFMEKWETLIRQLGYTGRIHWLTMEQVVGNPNREVPLIVPHSLNTHLAEGWKRKQKSVFVLPVSSPSLLLSYLHNLEEREKLERQR